MRFECMKHENAKREYRTLAGSSMTIQKITKNKLNSLFTRFVQARYDLSENFLLRLVVNALQCIVINL